MNVYIITAAEEHECSNPHCPKGKRILVGDKAIKAPPSSRLSVKPRYFHEKCYEGGKRGKR